MEISKQVPEILLVEDNDDDAEIIASIFLKNKINHSIRRIKTGEEAMDYLFQKGAFVDNDKNDIPRIVLLDINLPKLNGIDVLRRIRAQQRTEHMPVFIFTSSSSDYNAFESYRLGVTSYIRKQTSFEKFEEAVLETDLYLKNYKVLIVEDNASDAAIIFDELKSSNLRCSCEIVKNKDEYKKALDSFKPDIIFCDYDLPPKFDAIQAVRILKETELKIPFVLITGKLNEDLASACLTEGMDDYLMKGQLKRFPVTFVNNLRRKKIENEKNRAIEELKMSEKELKTLFESIGEVFFSVDMVNRKLIQISSACEKVYGYPKEAFFKDIELWQKCFHPDDKHILSGEFERLLKGEVVVGENRIIRPNKEVRWLQRKVIPTLDENGKLIRVDGIASDITERKHSELKLKEKNDDLNTYIYKTSHDLRGPTSSSQGLINLIKNKFKDEEFLGYIEMLEKCNIKMTSILDSLNVINKISGKPINKEEIDIKALVNDVISSLNHIPMSKDIDFKVEVDFKGNITSDKDLISSVLQNLIHNAIIYRKNKGDSFIKIQVYRENGSKIIEVSDNGVGIPVEFHAKIFDMFYRANENSNGSGLGLYIVKNILEKLGGEIELKSEAGKGCVFRITLPLAASV